MSKVKIHLYLLLFSEGRIKVGATEDWEACLQKYNTLSENLDGQWVRDEWSSDPLPEANRWAALEELRTLMEALSDHPINREWFDGVDWDEAQDLGKKVAKRYLHYQPSVGELLMKGLRGESVNEHQDSETQSTPERTEQRLSASRVSF